MKKMFTLIAVLALSVGLFAEETILATGPWEAQDWTISPTLLSDGGTELANIGVEAGDVINFYIEPTKEDWAFQIWEGHWETIYASICAPHLAGTLGYESYIACDLSVNGGKYALTITQEMIDAALTTQWWGGTFLINGDGVVVTKLTLASNTATTIFVDDKSGLTFRVTDSGEVNNVMVIFTKNGYPTYSGDVVIPSTVNYHDTTFTVTQIGFGAFRNCTGLTAITIPHTITSIGNYAFSGCPYLTSVTINSNTIVSQSYSFNYNLKNIFGDQITTYFLGDSVTTIGEHAFWGCSNLTSVTIGNSVTTIEELAFASCTSLTSVIIPESVTTIGERAFYDCPDLTKVEINSNAYLSQDFNSNDNQSPYYVFDFHVTEYIIGDSVTTIGKYAFFGCTGMTSVTIPNSVTTIGDGAFESCSGLTSVTIPNSVTSIGEDAFYDVNNIVYDGTATGSPWGAKCVNGFIDGYLVYSDDTKTTLCGCFTTATGEMIIPNSVTSIGDRAFHQCSGLTSITIPNSVTSIGKEAFYYCNSLTSPLYNATIFAYLPGSYEGAYIIPTGIQQIAGGAFESCYGLTSITIPNSVTTIGERAFSGCPRLTKTNFTGTIADWCKINFYDFSSNPIGCSSNFFINDVEVKDLVIDNVDTIGDYAFSNCSGLTSVTIGNSVTTIGRSAFESCPSLSSVTIPNSVTTIGNWAFEGCSGLTSVTIPNSVITIGDGAFESCSGLTSVTIPNSVTSIGEDAFYNVNNIVYDGTATGSPWGAKCVNGYVDGYLVYSDDTKTTLCGCFTTATGKMIIPNSVTSIGDRAFYHCSGLTSITIPNSVTTIKAATFQMCSSLTSITIPNSVTDIEGWGAFSGCTSLESVTIPNSVKTIGEGTFCNCYSLASVNIPNSVTTIGRLTFASCTTLVSIEIPASVTTIEECAFAWNPALTSITIPKSVTTIGREAFSGCSGLTSVTVQWADVNELPIMEEYVFNGIANWYGPSAATLHVPEGTERIYQAADQWSAFGTITTEQQSSTTNVITYSATEKLPEVTGEWDSGLHTDAFNVAITSHEFSNGIGTITFADDVTTIGHYAFANCYEMISITIPNSVTTIGYNAFYGCYGLTKTNYTGTIADWCKIKFNSDSTSNPICRSQNFFINDVEVKDLVIDNVDTIGDYAFYNCSSLTSVTIGYSVTTIGDYAFYNCSSLTSVTIGYSVTTIGDGAFESCSGLTSVTIPNSVTTIGCYAFYWCEGLTSITCEAITPPACDSWCFDGVEKSIPVYVPAQSIALYKTATGWKDFTNIQGFCDGEPYFNVQDTTICGQPYTFVWEGDSVRYGGEIEHGSSTWNGQYREWWDWKDRADTATRNYISVGGCDSTLLLVVHYPHYQYAIIKDTIEEGESFWGKYTETGVYYERTPNIYGCDSIVSELHLYVQPKPTYVVTLSVNNTKYGSVEGGGTYSKGDTVNLVAIPNKGYQFNQWSDGVTTNPRTIYSIDKDYTLTAQFGIKQCSWLVESNDLEMGAVYTDFTNEFYNYGTQITVEASANSGYKFVKWNDGKKYNPYKFSLLDDKYLLAIFMAEEKEMDTTQVQPSDTTATFTWPFIIGGFTYTLTIYLDAACTIPFCTLTFNQYGQLIGITFSARVPRRSALAEQEEGFTTTINGLSANTQYYFKMETKDEEGKLINTDEGTFETKVNVPTDINQTQDTIHQTRKYLHNGTLIIDRNGQHYSAMGERIR